MFSIERGEFDVALEANKLVLERRVARALLAVSDSTDLEENVVEDDRRLKPNVSKLVGRLDGNADSFSKI